jgi:hypothetical protein
MMASMAIYNQQGRELKRCSECGTLNYVEPQEITAPCYSWVHTTATAAGKWTEHESIPYSERDASGTVYISKR